MTTTHGRLKHIYDDNIKVDVKCKMWEYELDWSGLGQRPVAGSCEDGYKNAREYPEHLGNYKLLNVNSDLYRLFCNLNRDMISP